MITAQQVLDYIVSKAPPLGQEEGVRYGDPTAPVERVLVCWMATVNAIERAAAEGCQLMVVHEDLFFPPDYAREPVEKHLAGPVNRRRLAALAAGGITVIRAHATLDRLCILDDFGKVLGLPEPAVREGWDRVFEIAPATLDALCRQVKERLGLPDVRVWGAPERVVRRIALPWGGMSLSINAGYVHRQLCYEPDLLIAGEVDDYVFRACADANVALIETHHAGSENPGLRHFASLLQDNFPELSVVFYENPRPWRTWPTGPQGMARERLTELEDQFLQAPARRMLTSASWANDVPKDAGVYAIWEIASGRPVYVGETSGLKARMSDLGRSVNHTFRRSVAPELGIGQDDDTALSAAISKRYALSFLPVDLGRAELEEYLILRWVPEFDETAKRLRLGDRYRWVKPAEPLPRVFMAQTQSPDGDGA